MVEIELKRSWLFVPGNRQRMIDKAFGLAADALMLDLEDGVPPAAKEEARERIAEALERPRTEGGPVRFVRVNGIRHPDLDRDLSCAVRPGADGLVLPKVESPEQVQEMDERVGRVEAERKMVVGGLRFLVAIESPLGLLEAYRIARSSERVVGLLFGAEDYSRELGLPVVREKEARELLYARSAFATAAAAAHVQAVDGVWPDLNDIAGLWQDCWMARRLGFTGKSIIHPSQIEPVNHVFTPSSNDLEFARQVVEAFEQAERAGVGSITLGGQLIDRPIVERARATLRLAESLGVIRR
ncbi:MAG: CoA ester lyase [Armatimonadota bacterium]|nr:CoA ester lyase [Armatimonadota bacterium]MDR7439482.1 CoA ester lyase [Armatimonadota bacterium]MDR7563141.1 CoA ester lyase [Armatimonadota bacterium]MDR7567992.1 CoA ester lyase [Armatimonadota bacterium]MDR7600942.1 CoA ester lyase [Armatimonadota bacterium]